LLDGSGELNFAGGTVQIPEPKDSLDRFSRFEKLAEEKNREVMTVRVSAKSHKKAVQLHKFQRLSQANRAWGKDEKLLRCNLLIVPTSVNYKVLLAMGRGR
jgi:hypothetical protein